MDVTAAILSALRKTKHRGISRIAAHMRCDIAGAKIGHMIGRVIGLVRTDRDAATNSFAYGLEHNLRGVALGVAVGVRNHAG